MEFTMVRYTITVRKINGCNEFQTIELSADNRLEAVRKAHVGFPRPDWVIAAVQQHCENLVPTNYDRL